MVQLRAVLLACTVGCSAGFSFIPSSNWVSSSQRRDSHTIKMTSMVEAPKVVSGGSADVKEPLLLRAARGEVSLL